MRTIVVSIVGAAMLVMASPDALASPDHATALAHLQRGVSAFRAGNYAAAVSEFRRAQQLAPDKPNPYRWLALSHMQLRNCAAAVRNIDQFLARVPATEPRVAELRRLRALCNRGGVLHVTSTPANVALEVDGKAVGNTPYKASGLRPGTHTVRGRKTGYGAHEQTVVLTLGATASVRLRLQRRSAPIYQRWWFWSGVVGVAAAITTAAVLASRDAAPTMLPPIHCTPAGCM